MKPMRKDTVQYKKKGDSLNMVQLALFRAHGSLWPVSARGRKSDREMADRMRDEIRKRLERDGITIKTTVPASDGTMKPYRPRKRGGSAAA